VDPLKQKFTALRPSRLQCEDIFLVHFASFHWPATSLHSKSEDLAAGRLGHWPRRLNLSASVTNRDLKGRRRRVGQGDQSVGVEMEVSHVSNPLFPRFSSQPVCLLDDRLDPSGRLGRMTSNSRTQLSLRSNPNLVKYASPYRIGIRKYDPGTCSGLGTANILPITEVR
jgi:hypothetical protein